MKRARLWATTIGALGLVFAAGCTRSQVKTGVDIGTLACKDISAVLDDGTFTAICATEAEIAQLIEAGLLAQKNTPDGGAPASTSKGCRIVTGGGKTACLTDWQIARGISKVLDGRRALLIRDAGL